MNNDKTYTNCLVIFIDMLGTKAKKDIDSIYFDYSVFHSTILNKDTKFITDGRAGGIVSGEKIRIHTHTFSDCAYILYKYDNETLNTPEDLGLLIDNSLCHFERIILKLLNNGIIFRGGISYGKVFYEKENNILFGPAINEAFLLEDLHAKNPRILVSSSVANIYNAHFQRCVDNFNNPKNAQEKETAKFFKALGIENPKEMQGKMIIKDCTDSKYIFNYLNSIKKVAHIVTPEINTDTLDFKKALLAFAQNKSNEAIQNGDPNVQEKYDWLIEYIQS